MQGRLIVSTCGTSVLSNAYRQAHSYISQYSNAKTPDEIDQSAKSELETAIVQAKGQLSTANLQQAAKLSAELNALIHFYHFQSFPPQDYHLLLCTDTWLGEESAKLVKDYLKQKINLVEVYRQKDLRTDDLESFHVGLAELVRDLGPRLIEYRQRGFKIIFNLTGGFKSIQGFLQALAPIYADEIIYIFESQAALLRIPRLPIRLDAIDQVRQNLTAIRRLSLGLPVNVPHLSGATDLLVMQINDQMTLSPWGEVIWQQTKPTLYEQQLWESPYEHLVFGSHFAKSVSNLSPNRLRLVNEKIDDIVSYLTKKHNPKSLDFKSLRGNPSPPSTHECDAWSDQDARRIFMHFEGETLVLDTLEKALH